MTTQTITAGTSADVGARICSVLLIAGGIIGIGLSLWMATLAGQQPLFGVFALVFALVFAFTTWQGVNLWRGKPQGYKWGTVLFAVQVPSLSLGGLSYEFYTLLGFDIQLGSGVPLFDFNLGSALNAVYSPADQPTFIAINLIALAAVLYLVWRKPSA